MCLLLLFLFLCATKEFEFGVCVVEEMCDARRRDDEDMYYMISLFRSFNPFIFFSVWFPFP